MVTSFKFFKFVPKLPNGEPLEMPWQFKGFKFNTNWPLTQDTSNVCKFLYNLLSLVLFMILVSTIGAQIIFLSKNLTNLSLTVETLVTTFTGIALCIRIIVSMCRREMFADLLTKFYMNYYITKEENPKLHEMIDKDVRGVRYFTVSFFCVLALYLGKPLAEIMFYGEPGARPLPYNMIFLYDIQNPFYYFVTIFYTYWAGISVIFQLAAEDNLLAIVVANIYGRIIMIHDEIENIHTDALKASEKLNIGFHEFFHRRLNSAFDKLSDVYNFGKDANRFFTIMYFILIIYDSLQCCVLAFQLASYDVSVETIKYLVWLGGSVAEVMIMGNIGSKLIEVSVKTSDVLYFCNWEKILLLGSSRENARLMKKITIAMTGLQKPLEISGLNFFNLSLPISAKAIRTSMSYFMFLVTIKNASSKN